MKKVIKLTEADLEKLVQKIIREENGQQGEEQTDEPNPKDVENFMTAFNDKFIKKYPQYTKRISNKEERVMLAKAFADMLKITPSELNSAKTKM